MGRLTKAKIEKNYIKVVWVFAVLCVATLILIAYFSFSKTVITVTPSYEEVSTDFSLDVPATLPGMLIAATLSDKVTSYNVTETTESLDKAAGKVKIINNYTAEQALVATTRLLSDGGVLFRTTETVRVPARSELTVNVIADAAGPQGEIEPTHFTIVALWPGLQEKIYAESTEPMTRTGAKVTIATADDIRAVQDQLLDTLTTEAKAEITRNARITYPHLALLEDSFTQQIISETTDVKAAEQASSITAETTVQVIALATPDDTLREKIQDALQNALPENKKLSTHNQPLYEYHLESIDLDNQKAILTGSAKQLSTITLQHTILDRSEIINKDKQQVKAYFLSFEEIDDVVVEFSPFWVRRAPALENNIEIVLKEKQN